MFTFGVSDGNIQLYERLNDVCTFEFWSSTIGHSGAIKSLVWDPDHCHLASAGDGSAQVWNLTVDNTFTPVVSQPEKQPYIACTVHFYDKGASLLVSYLESGDMFCHSIEPWDLKWKKKVQSRIGNTALDVNFLLVSNLKDGVDKYAVPTFQHVQSYTHVILDNIPLQISVARQLELIDVGGDDGITPIMCFKAKIFLDDKAKDSSGDGEREDEAQSDGLQTLGSCTSIDLHYLDELFVVSDHDINEHILQSPSPLMETGAWDILEGHLLTDLLFGDMLEKLQTYLGPQYCQEDWKEAVDSMFLMDGDVGKALTALHAIKG
ncbi:hypothetical protein BDR04DRAFT_1161334 [Suillus decipiens]|nr:hypothetical protein BDR04DRAFT_1161334 [Suillus decipiens]